MIYTSTDDYEDFLETKDKKLRKDIEKANQEIKKGQFGTLDDLYRIHKL